MKKTSSSGSGAWGVLVLAMALAAGSAAQAQQNFHGGGPRTGPPQHMDARYGNNHFYPNRGVVVGGVPGRPVVFNRPGGRFYYSGGVWYAPRGPGFVVVAAPIGVFVPVLPSYYTTVWVGGAPYYYADDTYYTWDPSQSGYEVVAPPGNADAAATTEAPQPPPPQGDQMYVYPQNGQSAEQQASDKYQCHKWASSQTGFDPTQAGGGVPPDQLDGLRADYHRAMIACLEGRGYSAR
ncbi:MAG: DUF6515 family protein [Steroidobacteraceae bacterium]